MVYSLTTTLHAPSLRVINSRLVPQCLPPSTASSITLLVCPLGAATPSPSPSPDSHFLLMFTFATLWPSLVDVAGAVRAIRAELGASVCIPDEHPKTASASWAPVPHCLVCIYPLCGQFWSLSGEFKSFPSPALPSSLQVQVILCAHHGPGLRLRSGPGPGLGSESESGSGSGWPSCNLVLEFWIPTSLQSFSLGIWPQCSLGSPTTSIPEVSRGGKKKG